MRSRLPGHAAPNTGTPSTIANGAPTRFEDHRVNLRLSAAISASRSARLASSFAL
jgi:hypothetical protein